MILKTRHLDLFISFTFQELQYAIEEMHKQKSSYQQRLQERETDIDKLRNQVILKHSIFMFSFHVHSTILC